MQQLSQARISSVLTSARRQNRISRRSHASESRIHGRYDQIDREKREGSSTEDDILCLLESEREASELSLAQSIWESANLVRTAAIIWQHSIAYGCELAN